MLSAIHHDVLNRLLDENARFALDAKGTTNHLPMVLVALARMGATPARLQEHFDFWVETYAIEEVNPELSLSAENWNIFVGVPEAFGSLQRYFSQWVASSDASTVIQSVLRKVPFAPATQAFHAIIRIAYGLESANASEIAAGLAAYVATNLSCEIDFSDRPKAASVKEGLRLLSDRFCGSTWPHGSITGKLGAIASNQAFLDELRLPPMDSGFLDELARAAIDLYWQTSDFTVLHMVTGTYAARLLLAGVPADLAEQFYPSLWTAMAAAYVSVGAPRERSLELPEQVMEWEDILALAIDSMDDHVIKMVYTSHIESLGSDDPLYRAAASRLVQAC
ncbi:MAG: hypothetical protein JWQ01_2068 [Massilia sp.]|jgi:hypothetical protein|nr:hypothetical protein [Massilia sp.]